jgi:hypothetical protein
MKSLIEVCVVGSILICAAGAQEFNQPALQKGVSVQMPVADHAVEMRAADAQQATVVAITADGKLFAGTEPTEPSALTGKRPSHNESNSSSVSSRASLIAAGEASITLRSSWCVFHCPIPRPPGARGAQVGDHPGVDARHQTIGFLAFVVPEEQSARATGDIGHAGAGR